MSIMTMPPLDPAPLLSHDGAVLAQILLEQGRQGTQLAVIDSKLAPIADHETRLRALERFRWSVAGWAAAGGALSGFAGYLVGHLH
jgi:hypothetical protein